MSTSRTSAQAATSTREPAVRAAVPVTCEPAVQAAAPAHDGTLREATGPRDAESRAAQDLLPYLTRAFARTRARGWLAVSATGLILDLPQRLLVEELGPNRVMRFEDVDFPATLTHEPTRRFLREVGLPEEGFPFHLDTELPLPTLSGFHAEQAEYTEYTEYGEYGEYAEYGAGGFGPRPGHVLPKAADVLIRLGRLGPWDLAADGGTGALFTWNPADGNLQALHADVSTLAFALWLRQLETGTAVA